MSEDADKRVALTHRAGEVLERELDDVHEALSMYQEALELDERYAPTVDALLRIANLEDYRERAAEILEPRLEAQARWDELASLLSLKVDASTDPLDRRDKLRRIAEVHEEGRNDRDAAFEALSRALAEDPTDAETADHLERLAAGLGSHGRLADVFESRASSVLDPMGARVLYARLARIAEEDLNDDRRAIGAYVRAAEQVGDDEEILAALDRLHAKTESFTELADILERRISLSADPVERSAFLVRLGALREQHFSDLRGAFNAYQEVLEREPGDAVALEAMERLAEHEELALDVVQTLDSVYRQLGSTEKVAELYDVRIRLADSDGERVRLLIEAASMYENELGRVDRALEKIRRAFELDPRDQSLLDDLERLAGTANGWETLRGLIEKIEERGEVEHLILKDLNLRAATWYAEHLDDLEATEARLRSAIAADREGREAYERLYELLRMGSRESDLVDLLTAWARVELDDVLKRERYTEAAHLAESTLADPDKAAECYAAVLAVDPTDLSALAELSRLRAAAGRWDDVVELLDRRIEAEADPAKRLSLRHELARVHSAHRDAPDDAMSAYRGVLDEDPTDTGAITELERLYENAERWEDLSDLLERRLDVAESQDDQIAARVRLARLSEQRFGRREQAMEQLRAILDIQPANGDALDELERLLALDEKWDELVDLLEQRVQGAEAAGQTDVEVDILIRLAAVQEDQLGESQKAIATHERVLAMSPGNDGALRALLALHERAGDWSAVASDLEQLLAVLEPTEAIATAHRLAEVATEHLSDAARAEGALRAAYDLDPSREASRARLSAHYEAHSQWADLAAILADEESHASDDRQKVALLKRIASIYEEKLEDPGQAAVHLERASELTPEDRDVLLPLCDLYIAAGRAPDAIPVLRKIIESYGTRRVKEAAQFHHRLGKALEGMGDEAGAMQAYDNAFKIDLTNVSILRDLGKLCHKRGDYDRAQKTFRALLLQKLDASAGITKADVYYYLGDLSAKQGDPKKAKSMLQRALAEEKTHAQAKALLDSL
jgi:tetratricopeptide (TPR) repeat protein